MNKAGESCSWQECSIERLTKLDLLAISTEGSKQKYMSPPTLIIPKYTSELNKRTYKTSR